MTTQQTFDTSMARHPDIVAMRDRYDRVAGSPLAQVLEGLMFLGGAYAAISGWVVGFHTTSSALAVNDLVIGIAMMVMTLVCAGSAGRLFGLGWVVPLMGAWLVVATWAVQGSALTVGTILSNVITGACVLVLGVAVMALVRMKRAG